MNQNPETGSLLELEAEVLAEGRDWMRQRFEQKLQERADEISRHFSPAKPAVGASAQKKTQPAKRRRPGQR
jgi:hypothetical protein